MAEGAGPIGGGFYERTDPGNGEDVDRHRARLRQFSSGGPDTTPQP